MRAQWCPILSVTPETITCQAPLSMGFPRQEYWSGSSLPPPRDLPNPGVESAPRESPGLADGFFIPLSLRRSPQLRVGTCKQPRALEVQVV